MIRRLTHTGYIARRPGIGWYEISHPRRWWPGRVQLRIWPSDGGRGIRVPYKLGRGNRLLSAAETPRQLRSLAHMAGAR